MGELRSRVRAQQQQEGREEEREEERDHRDREEHAAAAEEGRSRMDVVAFLCGPPKMSDAMEKTLLKLGLPKQNVRLERWW